MIVFSNTTPIIALGSIQRLDLLPKLFGQIHLVSARRIMNNPVAA